MSSVDKSGATASDDGSTRNMEKVKSKAGDESKDKTNSNSDDKDKSKEKTNGKANETIKEKNKVKVHESSVKDAASSVSTGTTGSGKIRSDEISPIKGKSGTSSDVSVAEKASLESNKDSLEKRNVSEEKDNVSVEKK